MKKEVILLDDGIFHGVVIGFLNGGGVKKKQIGVIKETANSVIKNGCYHFRTYQEVEKPQLIKIEGWSDYLFSIKYDADIKNFTKSWGIKYFTVDELLKTASLTKDLNEIEKEVKKQEKKEAARAQIALKWRKRRITSEEIAQWRSDFAIKGHSIKEIAINHGRRYATVWDYIKGAGRHCD